MTVIISSYKQNGFFAIVKEFRELSLIKGTDRWTVHFWDRKQKIWTKELNTIYMVKFHAKKDFEEIIKRESGGRIKEYPNPQICESYSGNDIICRWKIVKSKEYEKPKNSQKVGPTSWEFDLSVGDYATD